ncbi:MAG TPA: hypothetical protein VGV89_07145 [Thermoplasmata archaeon]|nr:hypothetical protein [Thermoplasmata archaeon]
MAEEDAVTRADLAAIASNQRAQSVLLVGLAAALVALIGLLVVRGVIEWPDLIGRFRG